MFNNFLKTKRKMSNNDNTSGIGLGLFYCKTMITRLGGTIDVESEANKGSVFTIKFTALSCDGSNNASISCSQSDNYQLRELIGMARG